MKIQDIWWVFVQDPGFSGYVQDIFIYFQDPNESSAKTAQLMLT